MIKMEGLESEWGLRVLKRDGVLENNRHGGVGKQ